eukprot:evm.model.NODE_27998_length_27464_cov_27.523705.2
MLLPLLLFVVVEVDEGQGNHHLRDAVDSLFSSSGMVLLLLLPLLLLLLEEEQAEGRGLGETSN